MLTSPKRTWVNYIQPAPVKPFESIKCLVPTRAPTRPRARIMVLCVCYYGMPVFRFYHVLRMRCVCVCVVVVQLWCVRVCVCVVCVVVRVNDEYGGCV